MRDRLDWITERIIGAAIEVHRTPVEDAVIVEVKAVDALAPIHQAQVLSYLKLSGCKVGLLIGFHVTSLRNGIRRLVNNLPEQ